MTLSGLDYGVIAAFFAGIVMMGIWAGRQSGKSSSAYFLSDRDMPWWLIGVSMVATTFSADTPNLVTDIVRKNGISGNWVWWSMLLTGMLTVFVYARLWRRAGVLTDLEFYEIRYSGEWASFLRGFRSIYLGVFFNVMIMATVLLAGFKISNVLLGWSQMQTSIVLTVVILIFSTLGGYRGVVVTDFFQFILSMGGMIAAAIYIVGLPEVGGLSNLFDHANVSGSLDFIPDINNPEVFVPLFLIPIAVQWWSIWYPGAEPGGGGYVAQRMLSAKDEKNAVWATLFFNVAHYALRPWPWILIALASMIVYPSVTDIKGVSEDLLGDDMAFSAMLSFLPSGLLGLVIAALLAALMSTISTHLNWGASYVTHDFYKRFVENDASESKLVWVGRWTTVALMILAILFASVLREAYQAFQILLQIGAGTGLLFILRWFWWRVNALAEVVAMVVSFLIAIYFHVFEHVDLLAHQKLLIGVGITTVAWLATCYLGPTTDRDTMNRFYKLVRPYKKGWQPVLDAENMALTPQDSSLAKQVLMMLIGCVGVYALLFTIGYVLMGHWTLVLIAGVVSLITGGALYVMMRKEY